MKARIIVLLSWCILFAVPVVLLFTKAEQLMISLGILGFSFLAIQFLSWLYLSEKDKRIRNSRTDKLTRIRNKLGFDEGVRHEMEMVHRYGGDLGLILFCVDSFPSLVEKYGPTEGDRVLTGVAELLSGTIRSSDLFARWGKEEFVVLLTRCGLEDALKRGESLGRTVKKAILSERMPITVSLGVAIYKPGESLETLVNRARKGMETAQMEGHGLARACS